MWVGYPFYATVRGIGLEDVYHTHPACQVARSIESHYRVVGIPAGRAECPLCALHHAARPATRAPGRPEAPAPGQL